MTAPTIRPMTAADLPTAHGLSTAVGWPHRSQDWQMMLDLGDGLVLEDPGDGGVVGTALWWPMGEAGTLGMIIVAAAWQGRGLGRRLMAALLDAAGSRPLMLNATAAGAPLYESFGFRAVGVVNQQQGSYAGAPPLTPAVPVRTLEPGDRDAVTALDAAAYGVPRPHVLGRLLDAGTGVVLDGPDGPAGFAIRRRFGRGDVIGPVVAATEADAAALVQAVAVPGFTRLDIRAESAAFGDWLRKAGLDAVYPVTTMVRGDWPAATPPATRYGLVSQALG